MFVFIDKTYQKLLNLNKNKSVNLTPKLLYLQKSIFNLKLL